jgi:hypothetical protein
MNNLIPSLASLANNNKKIKQSQPNKTKWQKSNNKPTKGQ